MITYILLSILICSIGLNVFFISVSIPNVRKELAHWYKEAHQWKTLAEETEKTLYNERAQKIETKKPDKR